MELKNSFSDSTRALFMDCYACFKCGSNQNLELHHIFGRISNSPFNAAPVCRNCHDKILHTFEERFPLLRTNMRFLFQAGYDYAKNREWGDEDFFVQVIKSDNRFAPYLRSFVQTL